VEERETEKVGLERNREREKNDTVRATVWRERESRVI
jgi:hypothetical protein